MHHDWIIDVLIDLRRYALRNNLPGTAEGADVLLRLVRDEVATRSADDDDDDGGGQATGHGGSPPQGLPH